MAASTRFRSSIEYERISISSTAKSGTVFVVFPARNIVGTTVVPCSLFSRAATAIIAWAISTVELIPFSGSSPACDALP